MSLRMADYALCELMLSVDLARKSDAIPLATVAILTTKA